jgi:predicted RNA binding protein YcfA (HicA-like mRNA interferase family)
LQLIAKNRGRLVKMLAGLGFIITSGKGSHLKASYKGGGALAIPKDLKEGTLYAIYKQAINLLSNPS